jgi:S-methylmethionine-dependent homocysteine/selenocysteine methylase
MVMERLTAARKHPENKDDTRQFAIEQARRMLIEARVVDPGPKVDTLSPVIEAYKNQPHTPELVTETHQAIWKARGDEVGHNYEVVPCPYTEVEINELEAKGRRLGYLASEMGVGIWGKIFPNLYVDAGFTMNGDSIGIDAIEYTNDEEIHGWFDYDVSGLVSHDVDTIEAELLSQIEEEGRTVMNLEQYIVAGYDSILFTGELLEDRVNKLGSRDRKGSVLAAALGWDSDSGSSSISIGEAFQFIPDFMVRSVGSKEA